MMPARCAESAQFISRHHGLFPSPELQHFLHTVFSPEEAFGDAWNRWAASTPVQGISTALGRLLPLAAPALHRQRIQGDLAAEATRRYRQGKARNMLFRAELDRQLLRMAEAGIPVLLLKGAMLISDDSFDLGLRPMSDLDFMVPPDLLLRARDLLIADGWRAHSYFGSIDPKFTQGIRFGNPRDIYIDLHCHPIHQAGRAGLDDRLWDRSEPIPSNRQGVRRLGLEHQAIHLMAHGLLWSDPPAFRWVPDLMTVLKRADRPLDFHRLMQEAQALEVGATVGPALLWLHQTGFLVVPQEILAAFAAAPVTRRELLLRHALSSPFSGPFAHFATLLHHAGDGPVSGMVRLLPSYIRSRPIGGGSISAAVGRYIRRHLFRQGRQV